MFRVVSYRRKEISDRGERKTRSADFFQLERMIYGRRKGGNGFVLYLTTIIETRMNGGNILYCWWIEGWTNNWLVVLYCTVLLRGSSQTKEGRKYNVAANAVDSGYIGKGSSIVVVVVVIVIVVIIKIAVLHGKSN